MEIVDGHYKNHVVYLWVEEWAISLSEYRMGGGERISVGDISRGDEEY